MEKNVVIDAGSIKKTKELMDIECNKLIDLINTYKDMFEETKQIYDTDSAKTFRKLASSYLDYTLDYINNTFIPYVNYLESIKNTYIDEICTVENEIKGGAQ